MTLRIVDYGMGNLRSVQKAFAKVGVDAQITSDRQEIAAADQLVLPGVGAFRDAIHELKRLELEEVLREHVAQDKPFLGICLGLQLLFDVSYEDGEWPGLGIIPGSVVRFPADPQRKVPHMGWNTLKRLQDSPLLSGIPDQASVYFVHSYYVVPKDDSVVVARTEYGDEFVSIVGRGKMFATQFHPEKSQSVGLAILRNFASISCSCDD